MPSLSRILTILPLLTVALFSQSPPRPNFVFLLADDLGYGDLGCYGRQDLKTPRLDQLAAEGALLTAHYANGPSCTPTRAALLTGRYPQWVGGLECAIGAGNVGRYPDAVRLQLESELGLPSSEQTIAKLLKQAGYETAISGKWHLGFDPKFAPNLLGFDEAFYCSGGLMDYFHYIDGVATYSLFRNGNPIRAEGYFTDLLTDEAVKFIERERDSPFFLYVPYTTPHSPFQGPGDYRPHPLPPDSPLWSQGQAPPEVYRAMIESLDSSVGRILDALDTAGVSGDTVVIFASDNGGTASARNFPLRGIKGSTFEGGIRVPGIVRWPGKIKAGTVSGDPSLTFDFSRSIVEMAGPMIPGGKPLEGLDLVTSLAEGRPLPERRLFWRHERGVDIWGAVREGPLKYVRRIQGESVEEYLFDVVADISEERDLMQTQSAQLERMRGVYLDWERVTRQDRRGKPGWRPGKS